jgi:hypothetical protein
MVRCCGVGCFSYEGQFLFLSSSSSAADSVRTLSLCSFFDRGPSWTDSLAFDGGIAVHFAAFTSTAINFTECYCYYMGAAWEVWDDPPSAILSFLTVLHCNGWAIGANFCESTVPSISLSNFCENPAGAAVLQSGNDAVGMNVSQCIFVGDALQIDGSSGSTKFIVNFCVFSGSLPSSITGTGNSPNQTPPTIAVSPFGAAQCDNSAVVPASAFATSPASIAQSPSPSPGASMEQSTAESPSASLSSVLLASDVSSFSFFFSATESVHQSMCCVSTPNFSPSAVVTRTSPVHHSPALSSSNAFVSSTQGDFQWHKHEIEQERGRPCE